MIDEILISVGLRETRVALLAEGRLQELALERHDGGVPVGRIHLARVARVISGMQAAFVDYGAERSGFLTARDALSAGQALAEMGDGPVRIAEQVHEGQAILVQVTKEPIADKGARLTCDLALPGRHLVLRPKRPGIALSRRIEDEAERTRLLQLTEPLAAEGAGGFVVRTAAIGADGQALAADAAALQGLWRCIQERVGEVRPPALLHGDDDPVMRALRDHLYPSVARVVIDDAGALARARAYAERFLPWAVDRLEAHLGPEPLFDRHDVEADIEEALEQQVELASGGSISIEATEALTVIDVNSGRFTEGRDVEETALQTNLEAAAEIARQLRLRDIGGLIVIDFIHLEQLPNVPRLLQAFDSALALDRAPSRRSAMSSFGLVEMTRKRVREPLDAVMGEPCRSCAGSGRRPSPRAVADRILRQVEREAAALQGRALSIAAAPAVIAELEGPDGGGGDALEERLGSRLELEADPTFARDQFEIIPL